MGKAVAEIKKTVNKKKPFFTVAIGASAGGLEAVVELLKNLSPNTGMAYVYVQHLDPTHESKLTEILGRITTMKVVEARHLLAIKPNTVFVIPPNKDLSIIDGVLKLNPRAPKPKVHMPINKFFISLAEKQREHAIGIVLSGNANDGTAGLKAIKQAGGITIAQDDSAKIKSMPKSAIAEGVVDMVLSPTEIARELEGISQHPALLPEELKEKLESKFAAGDKGLTNIISLMKKSTGVDFSHYKLNTITRRIIRRMLLYKIDTLEEYYKYLKQHINEINVLYQDMLINVTSFFRDPDMMEFLKKAILPKILKTKSSKETIRIWIPACATGEEAYSLAIILMEALGDKAGNIPVQIFATDLSEIAISKSRVGLYSISDLERVSPERLQRFFEKIDGGYRVNKSIRDMCVFATHNVFKDPPFSRLDIISCCNLMIYLDAVLQKKILSIFHYCLRNNGFLVLGKSETISAVPELFLQAEKKYKLYYKKKDLSTNIADISYHVPGTKEIVTVPEHQVKRKKPVDPFTSLESTIDNILLRQYVPASIVVNIHLDILQFRGSTSFFLEPSQGRASLNLLKMARAGLAFELRNTIHKANKQGHRIKKSGLEIKVNDATHQVSIEVLPIDAAEDERLFLVVFEKMSASVLHETTASVAKNKLVQQLKEELASAKEDMRSMIEEQEANMEELQSANEEVISSNEELQSINEEMETSKEELESSNEELQTINHELQLRNEQLAESHEYSEVVFQTIQEAVVVLDKSFYVKKANDIFYELFKVSKEETEGMFFFELGNKQWNILKLRELLENVIANNKEFDRFEISHSFPMIGEKIMQLKARRVIQKSHRQQLVILSIIDITEHRQAEKIIAEREAWLSNMANNVPVMIWTSGADKTFNFFNKTWLTYTGHTLEQEKGYGWTERIHKEDMAIFLEEYNTHFEEQTAFKTEFRLKRNDGEYRWVLHVGEPSYAVNGEFAGYTGSCTEVHDKKLMLKEMEETVDYHTKELRETVKDLEYTNSELNQYAYVASHDLQEPLRKIITFSNRLSERSTHLEQEDSEYLNKIMLSAERMRKLINDLLNLSRTSRQSKEFVSTDLNLIIKDVQKDLDLIIEEKNVVITVGKLPVVKCIPLQMQQLFFNLMSNALKFSQDKRQPRISVTSKELKSADIKKFPSFDRDKTYCEFVFKDNGIGFRQEFAEQIFSIFQRLNDNSKYPGAGIGLALCKKIIINHRGMIFAKSALNKGAAFYIILPCEQ